VQEEADAAPPSSPRRRRCRPGGTALAVLAVLAVLVAIDLAAGFLLPILIAGLLALLLNPLVRWMARGWLPRWIAALLVLLALLGGLGSAAHALYEPAMQAAQQSPQLAYKLKQRGEQLLRPLQPAGAVGKAIDVIDTFDGNDARREVTVRESPGGLRATLGLVAQVGALVATVVMLGFLFLVFGEQLFRRVVSLAPRLSDKRRTVVIVRAVQSDVSRYVATITAINLGLGIAVGTALYLLGIQQWLLWGAVAALLNFAPYVGPAITALLLLCVGVLEFDQLLPVLLLPSVYLLLNLVESQLVTPYVLGQRFALNPVIILMWLLFWGWLWGIAGLLLAMPLLVCSKIVCSHLPRLQVWGRMLEH
jgi:predicted PurR-regulated permease PerM